MRNAVDSLAGRRGPDAAHSDRLLLPLGFRRFCQLVGVSGPDLPVFRPADLFTPEGKEAFSELSFWIEDLVDAWENYLHVGGYPQAISDFLQTGDIGTRFPRDLWDVVRGDAIRSAQLSDQTILALLERLARNITSPVNATSVATDTGVSNYHRVNDRIDDLAMNFLAWRCPQFADSGPSDTAQRKVYFIDPLIARLASLIDNQRYSPDPSQLTEQQLGLTLGRAIERQSPGSFAMGARIMYQRTPTGKEIDFVGPDLRGCFESKYVDQNWKSEAKTAKARCAEGIIATRRAHDLDDSIWATPAPSIAWLLDQ